MLIMGVVSRDGNIFEKLSGLQRIFFYYWTSFWTLFQLFIFFQSTQWKRTATNTLSYVLLYRIDNPIDRNCIQTWSVDRQWLYR